MIIKCIEAEVDERINSRLAKIISLSKVDIYDNDLIDAINHLVNFIRDRGQEVVGIHFITNSLEDPHHEMHSKKIALNEDSFKETTQTIKGLQSELLIWKYEKDTSFLLTSMRRLKVECTISLLSPQHHDSCVLILPKNLY